MAQCTVIFQERYGNDRREFVFEASSLFEAAFYGINRACKMWWYDPTKPITVRIDDGKDYQVMSARVLAWKESRPDLEWKRFG